MFTVNGVRFLRELDHPFKHHSLFDDDHVCNLRKHDQILSISLPSAILCFRHPNPKKVSKMDVQS